MLKTICGLGLLACGLAVAADTAPVPSCTLAPGWTQRGEARSYVGDNLFEYMDGNAEGYLIYGFQSMHGVSCAKGPVTLVIDISDFGEADSSYGMFTANRDPREPMAKLGAGGQIVPRRAMFAKGQYYVEIAAGPEGDYTATLKEWTAALEKATPGSTSPPVALSWFPAEKQQTLRLVPESVLGIRLLRRGYAAQYDFGKAFVVTEASAESAGALMQKLRARFTDTAAARAGDEAFQGNDKYLGRLCFFRKGRYIGGYANVADGQDPVALSAALAAKLP
ncbi:MAG: DUF6599 family protein [Bryobacteraceae bacterium]|jgi:hypothetical protein